MTSEKELFQSVLVIQKWVLGGEVDQSLMKGFKEDIVKQFSKECS